MRVFSLTDLNRKSEDVLRAACLGPVYITRYGKRRFVLMSSEQFDNHCRSDDPRKVYIAGETPSDLAEIFAADLDKLASGEGYEE